MLIFVHITQIIGNYSGTLSFTAFATLIPEGVLEMGKQSGDS
jgi:hypothetical protein